MNNCFETYAYYINLFIYIDLQPYHPCLYLSICLSSTGKNIQELDDTCAVRTAGLKDQKLKIVLVRACHLSAFLVDIS
jgi:hypothetical protein